jgi:hypothetical protein
MFTSNMGIGLLGKDTDRAQLPIELQTSSLAELVKERTLEARGLCFED